MDSTSGEFESYLKPNTSPEHNRPGRRWADTYTRSHDLVGLPVLLTVIKVMDLSFFFSRFALDPVLPGDSGS